MPTHALFPGTFDPPTLGHLDLVRRAVRLFDRVTVALAEHPSKSALFPLEERMALLKECTAGLSGVTIERIDGLVVDACDALGCDLIVRGVRCGTDFDYEAQMAATNHAISERIDTVLLPTTPALSHITGTLVRQVASMGGNTEALVPGPVAAALRERFGGK